MTPPTGFRKTPFLSGVFLITFSLLIFQIVQTRILSVIAWYYLAFFAISVAMLGMTVGAVWVYLRPERFAVFTPAHYAVPVRAYGCSGNAGVPHFAVLPDHRHSRFAYHGDLLELILNRYGRAVCIFRRRSESGPDAKPVPYRAGLRIRSSRRSAGMPSHHRHPECCRWSHHGHFSRSDFRVVCYRFCG